MQNLPVALLVIIYLAIGCGEWYIALRRTLACARGERTTLVTLVFIENLLALFVLSTFIRDNNWFIAIAYAVGGSLGALLVDCKAPQAKTPT
jgi:hypothetical protein